jgi:O-antigen/teichoic acid export membrane protein
LTIVFLAPPAIVASFAAQPLIHTLFGDQWDNAVNVAEVLGLWMVLKVLMFFSMPTLISLRLEKRLFFVRIGLLFVQFMFLIIAAKYGVIYVAVGLSMAACVQIFAESRLIFDAFGLRLTDYLLYCRRSAYVCIATLLTCFLVRLVPLDGAPPVFTLLIYALSNTVTWLLALYAFRHPLSVHVTALAASISSSLTLRR